ncbi:hypothetical protein [Ktedonospora formicarum]|uniref:Uncharacterized protein n=1 Tax=Ktedonospora formicarum TaxID=2778364 RepID=A0A8J3ID16_9CHLR|nr:hypothetical protein [Ktedonospora formicarum]GHO50955.1 hypothetical protein KSX_91180 [Ktedonospora formicarum]
MEWILLFLAIFVLLYVLMVVSQAQRLKAQTRPFPSEWSASFIHSVKKTQTSLWIVWTMLGAHAVAFLLPSMIGDNPGMRWSASVFALFDLLGAIVLYGLWRWTKTLIRRAAIGARKARFPEQYDA